MEEERLEYKTIFETIGDAIILRDHNSMMLEANPAAYKMHGYTRKEFLKLVPSDIVHPDHRHKIDEFLRAMSEDRPFRTESCHIRKDKSPFPVEVTATIINYQGEKCRLIVIKDITTRKKEEEKIRQELSRLSEIEKRAAESKLKTLQVQMSPHFIFNSLNSIQHFIIRNDNKLALNYLSKFSKLVRQILENSENTYVLISNELKILQYYIDLESLRFENKFDYYIEIDTAIDIYSVEIPPMIIQPFIENALLHGLLNKSGRGYIQLKMVKKDNRIICTIEDNGVGRKEAARIKASKILQHKSMGISVTQERLELINENFAEKIIINTVDVVDKNNNPMGTRVEISFPVE